MNPAKKPPPLSPPPLRLSFGTDSVDRRHFQFIKPFKIGRVEDCDVCINDEYVSRNHVEVSFANGQWWVRDLGSSNGTYINGERIDSVPIVGPTTMRLGIAGPTVRLDAEQAVSEPVTPVGSDTRVAEYVERYFGKGAAGKTMGEHTMYVRRAFEQVQTKQRWRYRWIMAALTFAIFAAAGYAVYLHQQDSRQKDLARILFYEMKTMDLNIANVERLILDSNNKQGIEEIQKYHDRRREMEKTYDRFLSTLHVYNAKMTPQEQLILRVARIFGECELAMPPGFVPEVEEYIKKWQSSGRYATDIRIAKEKGYTAKIPEELLAQDLPPQFFYLALQESNFDPYASGPMTRKGIAKGMWQFIPETAIQYGLKIGPLAAFPRPDPADDRHRYDRSTKAAARYLKDLFSTDAQASGLLVMACYNWGEGNVLPLVRSMPANPRERNFWRLLTAYREKIPKETYDYVFYIVSAAVIGENPRLFGFDFDNPLAPSERK